MTTYDIIMLKTSQNMPTDVKHVLDKISPCIQEMGGVLSNTQVTSVRTYDSKSKCDIAITEGLKEYNQIDFQAYIDEESGNIILFIDGLEIPYIKKSIRLSEVIFEDAKTEEAFCNSKRSTYDAKQDAIYVEENVGSLKYLMKVDSSSHCIYVWITKQNRRSRKC